MILRGNEFGCVINASGARNFDGNGYPLHLLLGPLGLKWTGSTFVAKTTTLAARPGNMPVGSDRITPRELIPRCIRMNHRTAIALNAVGLTGPGAAHLFVHMGWERRIHSFFLSFMSVGDTREDRLNELARFVQVMKQFLPDFQAPVGLKLNVSCPNVGLVQSKLVGEIRDALDVAQALNVPLVPKFSVMVPVEAIAEIAELEGCDGICLSNTIPWRKLPEWIDWDRLFGPGESPLAALGGGGLSGAPLLPIVVGHVAKLRAAGTTKPIIAGGGVLSCRDADCLIAAGADAISLGSIAILRPWRVQRVIRHINRRMNLLAGQDYVQSHRGVVRSSPL